LLRAILAVYEFYPGSKTEQTTTETAKVYKLIPKKTITFMREIRKITTIRPNCKNPPVLGKFVAMCTDCAISAG
jgi:hypothetical protein